jgi:hypothetical protein
MGIQRFDHEPLIRMSGTYLRPAHVFTLPIDCGREPLLDAVTDVPRSPCMRTTFITLAVGVPNTAVTAEADLMLPCWKRAAMR